MCGSSEARVGVHNLDLYIGAYGGRLEVDDGNECLVYASKDYYADNDYTNDDSPHNPLEERAIMGATLKERFTKEELVEVILQLVDNGREG